MSKENQEEIEKRDTQVASFYDEITIKDKNGKAKLGENKKPLIAEGKDFQITIND